ncbi:MAG: hypothetical protein LH630_09970 [Actinomycetia bacterium]|nr:hypothetical protein [Actinomycetes bacterium]
MTSTTTGSERRPVVTHHLALQEESGAGTTWLLGGGALHNSFLAEGPVDGTWIRYRVESADRDEHV